MGFIKNHSTISGKQDVFTESCITVLIEQCVFIESSITISGR